MWNGTLFVDLDWPLNASSLLSASAELLVFSALSSSRGSVVSWCGSVIVMDCQLVSFDSHPCKSLLIHRRTIAIVLRKRFHLVYRHIQTFGHSCPCLQCVNICCVFVGDISFEIKTEADSNRYPHDDIPSTGMIVSHYESILCTMFAVIFMSFYNMHLCKWGSSCLLKIQLYICLSVCLSVELNVKILLESHPEHRPSLHV